MNAATVAGEKRSIRKTLFFIATYAISFGCLFWVLAHTNYQQMAHDVARMHWGWVTFAMVTDVLVYVFHGWRWSLLLSPLAPAPFWRSVRAIYVGLFANEILPFRTGELIRCYLQARWNALPFSVTLSSALIERIFDGVWLVICLAVALRITHVPTAYVNVGTTVAVAVLAGGVLVGAAMFWKESTYAALSRNRHLRHIAVILEDLHIIGHSRFLYFSAVASAPYLLLQVLPIWAMGKAYGGVDLSLGQAFVIMVIVRIAAVVPQAPGNLGLFNAAAIAGLSLFGIDKMTASNFSLVLWAVITLPLLVVGSIALAITGTRIGELHHQARKSMKQPSVG
jgi:glycosyltransferase 2 family protein